METLRQSFFNDLEFRNWYEKRQMPVVFEHYRRVLEAVHDEDFRAILLSVIKKWLDDAYWQFGLEVGKQKIIFKQLPDPSFSMPKNKPCLTLVKEKFRWLPPRGHYLFYHYELEFNHTDKQLEIFTQLIPNSLLNLLTHFLAHCHAKEELENDCPFRAR